jgi:hypothetical protein
VIPLSDVAEKEKACKKWWFYACDPRTSSFPDQDVGIVRGKVFGNPEEVQIMKSSQ